MRSSPATLPEVLEPIADELSAIDLIVGGLDAESDPTRRAELTMELVRRTSVVEDTMERGVYNLLDERSPTVSETGRHHSTRVREAMVLVDRHIRHVDAADVHTSDPEGFERELVDFEETLAEVRSWEIVELYPVLAGLRTEDRTAMHDHVDVAHRHASEHPAPGGAVKRMIHKVGAKMDRYPDIADHAHSPNHS